MSAEKFLVTGATGQTGHDTVQRLVEKGHAVRALVHREDERSEALRGTGAEVVVGDLLGACPSNIRKDAILESYCPICGCRDAIFPQRGFE